MKLNSLIAQCFVNESTKDRYLAQFGEETALMTVEITKLVFTQLVSDLRYFKTIAAQPGKHRRDHVETKYLVTRITLQKFTTQYYHESTKVRYLVQFGNESILSNIELNEEEFCELLRDAGKVNKIQAQPRKDSDRFFEIDYLIIE
jgi:hypothetical protein